MTNHIGEGRLVKVLLPGNLVQAMDAVIARSTGYGDRSEFIADAVQGHLAELAALGGSRAGGFAQPDATGESGVKPTRVPASAPGSAAYDLKTSIPPAPAGAATLIRLQRSGGGPTWGMHNRDFPTLWALWHLAEATDNAGAPVELSRWTGEIVQLAWRISQELPASQYDTSGFPSNPAKREAAEGRFIRFFLGTEDGKGPLFDLALAGSHDGLVAPTEAGVALLGALEGFGCRRDQVVERSWSEAYLAHLSRYAPEDAAFMDEVLRLIAGGAADRTSLVKAAGAAYPEWSRSVLETNVAGFIARGREWGLVRQKQEKGKYVLEEGAQEVVRAAVKEGSGD